ncbi:MAG: helix-turn-helix domain-containing protein [Candidatus Solibacter sp.]
MNTISKLAGKLRDTEYRKAFVASQINIGIPFQIRAMLKNRHGWTQETIAQRAHMLQPRISGLMTPGKTRPNIETLRRIAEAFDCGLIVRFAPFSELAKWSEEFDPESFSVPSFDDDTGFIERKPQQVASIFLGTGQPELVNRQLAATPSPLEQAQRKGNLLVMPAPTQAVAEQTLQGLGGYAGLQR